MKKIISLILTASVFLMLAGCTQEARPDYEYLSAQLSEINEKYGFEYFDMFIYEDAYQVYLSLESEDDVLLSFHTDENGSISDITATAYGKTTSDDRKKAAYRDFVQNLIGVFCNLSNEDRNGVNENLSYDSIDKYFTDLYETYTCGRYNFIFSSNSEFTYTYCRYFEAMENPTGPENDTE